VPLKKPSQLFKSEVVEEELSSPVKKYLNETYQQFQGTLSNIENLQEKIDQIYTEYPKTFELLAEEVSNRVTKSDLDNVMYSQLEVVDRNFKEIQEKVKGVNRKDLREFKNNVSQLTEIVNNLIETELPQYKNRVTKTEVKLSDKFQSTENKVTDELNKFSTFLQERIGEFDIDLEQTKEDVLNTNETFSKLKTIVKDEHLENKQKLEQFSETLNQFNSEANNFRDSLSDSLENDIDNFKKELKSLVSADFIVLEKHVKDDNDKLEEKINTYIEDNQKELVKLKDDVIDDVTDIFKGDIAENVKKLEDKIKNIQEQYDNIKPEDILQEGLLNIQSNEKNSDPLTPLDQNFVTTKQLQDHYRVFLNRVQEQLSTLGGGGETRLEFLDDVDRDTALVDGKVLQYNAATKKWRGASAAGIGTQDNLITSGIITAGNVTIGGITTALVVNGDGAITGVLTVGQNSVTLDGTSDVVQVGTALTLGHTQGIQFHTQNLHASGFEVNQINASGIATLGSSASGQADLQYQGVSKFKTQSWGNFSYGSLVVNGDLKVNKYTPVGRLKIGQNDEFTINHDSTNTSITERVGDININASTVSISTNFSVGGDAEFNGNVSIAGTLTYEDVTNIDSVGVITARSAVHVGAGLSVAGVSTFTGYGNSSDDAIIAWKNINLDSNFYKLQLGNYQYLQIYHKNGDSYVGHTTATGDLNLQSARNIYITPDTPADSGNAGGGPGYRGITLQSGRVDIHDHVNVTGVVTASSFSGSLSGIATGADKVYVDESEDDNTVYNIVFTDENPGEGNSYHTLQVDHTGLSFNPGANLLASASIQASSWVRSSKYYDHNDTTTFIDFANGDFLFKTANTTRVTINDSGLNVSGVATASSLHVGTGLSVGTTLNVGTALDVGTGLSVGTNLSVGGNSDLNGDLDVAGTTTFNDDVTFDGATAGRDIVFDRSESELKFADSSKIIMGSPGEDLEIFHDGYKSVIAHNGHGDLYIRAGLGEKIHFQKYSGGDTLADFNTDGSIDLYYDNTQRFSTSGIGATVFGQLDTTDLYVTGIVTTHNVTTGVNDSVGINTDNPTAYIHVHNPSVYGLYGLRLTNNATGIGYTHGFSLEVDNNQDARIINNGNKSIKFETNQAERLRITSGGEVGIGTATIRNSRAMQLTGESNSIFLITGNAPSICLNSDPDDSSDNDRTFLGQAAGSNHFTNGSAAGDTILRGTTSGKIHFALGSSIKSSIDSSGNFSLTSGTFSIPDTIEHYLDTNTKIRFPANDTISFETAGDERLRMASDGNVGIGTTNPQAQLEVNVGSATTAFNIVGTEGQLFSVTNNLSSGSIFSVNDISGSPSIDVDADGTIQLAPLLATEKVGIGTTNPQAKLDVNGTLKVGTGVTALTNGNVSIGGTFEIFESSGVTNQNYSEFKLSTFSIGQHNNIGSMKIMNNNATGTLIIGAGGGGGYGGITLYNKNLNAKYLDANNEGSVDLYYDGGLRFATTGYGVSVTGLEVAGVSTFVDDMNVANGSGIIEDAGGQLKIRANTFNFKDIGDTRQMLFISQLGGAKLYHNGTEKFETLGFGATVYGTTQTQQLNVSGISTVQDFHIKGNNVLINHDNSYSGVTTIGAYYYDKLVINSAIDSDNAALLANNEIALGWSSHPFGDAYFSKKVRAAEFGEFNLISAGIGSTHVNLSVTVATKSTDHRYHGQGSNSGYVVDNIQSPFFTFTPGRKYRFNQSDGTNSSHQIKFYLEADRTTLYETGVTYNGTAGNAGAYTEIEITDSTPNVLHYQCVNHPYMGNAFQTNSNSASKKFDSDITLSDDVKAIFGSTGAGDLQIFHGSTGNYINRNVIRTTNTNELLVEVANGSNGIAFNHRTGNGNNDFENMITATPNAGVDLYFNGNKRIETTNEGILVSGGTTTGTLNVTGISTFVGTVYLENDVYFNTANNGNIQFDTSDNSLKIGHNQGLNTQVKLKFGPSGSFQIFQHSTAGAFIENGGGGFEIKNKSGFPLYLKSHTSEDGIAIKNHNGMSGSSYVELYSSDVEKLRTTNEGVLVSGVVTATSFKGPSGVTATFIGDGSGLTGVTASGSGIVIKDGGSVVGTAGTIDFGANLSVSAVSAGIVTITGAASGGGVTVQDEGSALSTTATTLNFVGDGVVASGTGATKTITIPGGGGSSAGGGLFPIEGERSGSTGANQYYAIGNGATTDQGMVIPVDTSLRYMTLRSDATANSLRVSLYLNGSDSGYSVTIANGLSATADFTSNPLSISAGDNIAFRVTQNSVSATTVVAGWFHQNAVLPDSLVGTALSVSGISTIGNVLVGGGTTDLVVNGDARVTGILTVGTGSITIDPNEDKIQVGKVVLPTGNATTDTDAIAFAIALG